MAGELSSRMVTIGDRVSNRVARRLDRIRIAFLPDSPLSQELEFTLGSVIDRMTIAGHQPNELVPCESCQELLPLVQQAITQMLQQQGQGNAPPAQ